MRLLCSISRQAIILCMAVMLSTSGVAGVIRAQTPSNSAASNSLATTDQTAAQNASSLKLSPTAEEAAKIAGVMPLILKLQSLPEKDRGVGGGTMTLEALSLRQEITEQVLTVSLEADGAIAEIDSELTEIGEIQADLQAKRDKIMNINAVASIVTSGGLGVVATALQFKDTTANLGNGIGVASGAASIVLSVLGLHQQKGGKGQFGIAPNMLAMPLGKEPGFHSTYPNEIWTYLNDVPPGSTDKKTRIELSVARWKDRGHLEAKDSPKADKKIVLMTTGSSSKQKLSLDDLSDRAAMLSDLRVWILIMKRDMSKLMLSMRTM